MINKKRINLEEINVVRVVVAINVFSIGVKDNVSDRRVCVFKLLRQQTVTDLLNANTVDDKYLGRVMKHCSLFL